MPISYAFTSSKVVLSPAEGLNNLFQVVMAAAAAAGLHRNGIRRTAFSTGDLQALSVLPTKNSPSPPDPTNANLHRYVHTDTLALSYKAADLYAV